ncbi:L-amino-acid oxidase [Cladorrhinum samala]|uniref:L-amino-acid oxidase n=1 Tax=Cladorrhinum samala TaxID=585594 RepID=A0AAV9HY33_9PEZI|nr:L-amino-acid oxidase [Cladorrhinum samala]
MILEDLKIPNLEIDILEANERIGGRIWTHHFSDRTHAYYDVGAMRFPDIKSMARTFKLFDTVSAPLRDYYLNGVNTPTLFNSRFHQPDVSDPYEISVSKGGNVPDDVVDSWSDILEAAFERYKKVLRVDWEAGYKLLMDEADHMSTRQFLANGGPKGELRKLDYFSIQWMETQNTATGLFDQAFSESVIDSLDFESKIDGKSVEWKCVEGGTTVVIEGMRDYLKKTNIEIKKRVVSIERDLSRLDEADMLLQISGEDKPREGYSTVFATAPLGCLARMNLNNLDLHPSTRDAIRCLKYDDSVKIAIQFTRPWWRQESKITKGGVANTDLSIRVCVYPSYNTEDPIDQPAVLLVSYTWSQDAIRVASLLNAGPEAEQELIDFVLRDIGRLHSQTITEEAIRETFAGIWHGHSWSNDPYSSGAFALFGPGQFSNLYPYLIRPAADCKFHIVGEAASSHHAWIAGSLDSAYYAVAKFLKRFGLDQQYLPKIKEKWGVLHDLDAGVHGSLHVVNLLGTLSEGEHVRV